MNPKIYNLFIWGCVVCIAGLAVLFFFRYEPVSIEIPVLTRQQVEAHKAEIQQAAQKRQNAENARKRQSLESQMYQCTSNDACVIVDKHPCGCLQGPSAVTAINGSFALEFSKLMDKQFPNTMTCPTTASTEKECSPSALAVCKDSRCQIVY